MQIPADTNPSNVELMLITFVQQIPEPVLSKEVTKMLTEAYESSEPAKVAEALNKLQKPERSLLDAFIDYWKKLLAAHPKKVDGVAHIARVFTPLLTQENHAIASRMIPTMTFMLENV